MRVSGHQPQASRFHPLALSQHLRQMSGIRLRHDPATDPGGAGGALHLRRSHDRSRRPYRSGGVYAIGEVAFTGLHGANRMASNSLLECLVFAAAAADDIRSRLEYAPEPPPLPDWDESRVTDSDEEVVVSHNWAELRQFMWDYVGIVRTDKPAARPASSDLIVAGNRRVLR